MKILALTRYTCLGASSRLRSYQYLSILRTMGIDVHVSPLLRDDYLIRLYTNKPINWFMVCADYLMQAIKLLSARKFDLLWIEKELFPNLPAWFEQALNVLGIKYIVDFDDAIFHNYDATSSILKKALASKIDKVMSNSALVICGNDYLAERAHVAGATRVEIIPTVIDINRYTVFETKANPKLVIGWIGTPRTVKYLEIIVPALQIVTNEFPLQLRVIGADFAAQNLDIDCRCWTENSEVSEIQNCDVGIMPLIDSPWERGKCGYKLIQYMACGKPVIASPVGLNKEIVQQDVNGYLASTVDEWVQAFRALYFDAQNRLAMGAEGRKLVEEKYTLQVTAPRLVQLFNEVISTN